MGFCSFTFQCPKISKPNFSLYKIKCTYSLLPLIYQLIYEHIHTVLLFKTKTTNRSKFLLLDSRAVIHLFWHQGPVSWKTNFPRTRGRGWFQDDSRILHLLCTLFLIWCDYWSDRRYCSTAWNLGTPASASSWFVTLVSHKTYLAMKTFFSIFWYFCLAQDLFVRLMILLIYT